MKIYFKENEGATNVKELFQKGFVGMYFKITYKDPEFTIQQCHGARRSFLDLYWIAKTYFPKTTKAQIAKIVTVNYTCFYCDTIRKFVFLKPIFLGNNFSFVCGEQYHQDFKDSNKRSYNDILKLAKEWKEE